MSQKLSRGNCYFPEMRPTVAARREWLAAKHLWLCGLDADDPKGVCESDQNE